MNSHNKSRQKNPSFWTRLVGRIARDWNAIVGFYVKCRYRNFWRKLENKYSGQRGWVIGNGPSLKVGDLDQLKDEVTIASNKIFLAFDQTDWRPTFVTAVDTVLWAKIKRLCLQKYPVTLLSHLLFNPITDTFGKKMVFWKTLPVATKNPAEECLFSDDLSKGMNGGYSVTYENLQLACYLGLNPIYIIGCDHFYKGEGRVKPNETVESKAVNHFHPDYRKKGEPVSAASIDEMNKAYLQAEAYAKKQGIRIINATRGGYLEVFERGDIDLILDQ